MWLQYIAYSNMWCMTGLCSEKQIYRGFGVKVVSDCDEKLRFISKRWAGVAAGCRLLVTMYTGTGRRAARAELRMCYKTPLCKRKGHRTLEFLEKYD